MNDIVKASVQLPAYIQNAVSAEIFDELAGGVTSGFPVISYKGKVWRIRVKGEQQAYVDENGDPMPAIEVVLLKSVERLSKTFYESQYSEGDQEKPRCWSSDGVRPDKGVLNPIALLCEGCPNNVWGSKVTDQGKSTKACTDVRRIAVAFAYQLQEVVKGKRGMDDVDVMLLRVPPASLNPLKDYAERVLKPKSIPPFVVVTRIGFDAEAAYPKFTFKGTSFLSEDEFKISEALRNGTEVARVLNESTEYDAGGTTTSGDEATVATATEEVSNVTPLASSKNKGKRTPVEEEIAASEAEVVEGVAPTPAAPAASKQAGPEAAPTQPTGDEPDLDAMLSSILD